MIKSELERQRISEIIIHWCGHAKIMPRLRNYDIPSLVSQIMDEFYHVTLSCGHKVNDFREGVDLEFEDYVVDRSDMEHGGGMRIVFGSYCKDCAEKYIKESGARKV